MRYLLFMAIVFAVFFWALSNIGDKYVEKQGDILPEKPSNGLIKLNDEGKPVPADSQTSDQQPPTRRIVEY